MVYLVTVTLNDGKVWATRAKRVYQQIDFTILVFDRLSRFPAIHKAVTIAHAAVRNIDIKELES